MKKKLIALLTAVCMMAAPIGVMAEDIDNMTIEELREAYRELLAENEALKAEQGGSSSAESELSQDGDIYRLTALGIEEIDSVTVYGETYKPEEGNTFLVVQMEATNISNEDGSLNYFNFDCYLNGRSIGIAEDCTPGGYENILNGDIRSGKIREGYLTFEAPSDWQELEINYKEDYMNPNITLIITPDSFSE